MNRFFLTLLLAMALFPAFAQQKMNEDVDPFKADLLLKKITQAWDVTWERFYHSKTSQFFDYISSYEKGKELSYLPTFEEVTRQYPNPYGYCTGMEDGMIHGGTMLCAIVDRYKATGEKELAEAAGKVYLGMKRCATLHGIPGFVARNLCPEDGISFYHNSSRDQYTHFVHGLWHYYRSPLSGETEKTEIRNILRQIADRMYRNVTPENNFNALNADDREESLMRMWNNWGPHEYARLPMIYAAAWDVTGDSMYYALYRCYLADAIEHSEKMESNYYHMYGVIIVQAQVSFELLYLLEMDPDLKNRLKKLLNYTADRCFRMATDYMDEIREMDRDTLAILPPDWRNVPMDPFAPWLSDEYDWPNLGKKFTKIYDLWRDVGACLWATFLPDDHEQKDLRVNLLEEMVQTMDYHHCAAIVVHHIAAYWKARSMSTVHNVMASDRR